MFSLSFFTMKEKKLAPVTGNSLEVHSVNSVIEMYLIISLSL